MVLKIDPWLPGARNGSKALNTKRKKGHVGVTEVVIF